jgi:hypothetical protein
MRPTGEAREPTGRQRSSESEVSGSLEQWVVAIGDQTRLGVSGQELRPWGAMMKQSVPNKDMNTKAEELESFPGNNQ